MENDVKHTKLEKKEGRVKRVISPKACGEVVELYFHGFFWEDAALRANIQSALWPSTSPIDARNVLSP